MTKNLLASWVAVTLTSIGGAAFAQAQAPAPTGGAVELGVRTGFGLPLGNEGRTAMDTADTKLSNDLHGNIPLWLDAGYRINPNLYVGLFFQYAFGLVNNGQNPMCSQSGNSCSASDIRLGLNLHYHFLPGQSFDPWVGVGAGYEWLKFSVSAPGVSGDATAGGFEFANLQLGGDITASPTFKIGPFVSFSMGQYASLSVSATNGMSADMDITSKSLHEWLLFGARGAFDIGI